MSGKTTRRHEMSKMCPLCKPVQENYDRITDGCAQLNKRNGIMERENIDLRRNIRSLQLQIGLDNPPKLSTDDRERLKKCKLAREISPRHGGMIAEDQDWIISLVDRLSGDGK